MMTCARVRQFNSKPPPEVTIEPKIPDTSTPNATAKPQKTTTDNLPKNYHRTILTVKKAGKDQMSPQIFFVGIIFYSFCFPTLGWMTYLTVK